MNHKAGGHWAPSSSREIGIGSSRRSLQWCLMMCWLETCRIRCGRDGISELGRTERDVCFFSFYHWEVEVQGGWGFVCEENQKQVRLWPPESSPGLCQHTSCWVANSSAAFASWDKLNINSILMYASSNRFTFNQTINSQTQTPLSFLAVSLCSLFLRFKSLKGRGFSVSESTVPLGHNTVGLEIRIQIIWEQQNEF